jgi:hypothetical protein
MNDPDFWKKHDPETGELNAVKFLRLSLAAARLQRQRKRATPKATEEMWC